MSDPTINMEEMGREMARYCGGLPLAVVVLGGLLAKNPTLHDWERIYRNIKSYLMRSRKDNYKQQDSGVSDVLVLSYQDLSYHLKSCFLYLAHFPEDHEIPTKTLVRMWVAEGIVSKEDVGEGYLVELIERCMIQVGRTSSSDGRVKTCQMHDLMRDLCLSKAKEENFLEIISGFQQVETSSSSMVTLTRGTIDKVRRRAIYLDHFPPIESTSTIAEEARARAISTNDNKNEDADDIYVKLNPENDTPLRSLLILSYPSRERPETEVVHWMLRKLELKKFTLLRVLSLEKLALGEKLPKAIGNLIHLKFLSFKDSILLHFPSFIRNLGCIETLDLRLLSPLGHDEQMTCLVMNEVIGRMRWLRHLYLPYHLNVGKSKVQWEKLSNLETLKHFDAKQWDIKDLARLTSKLQKLNVQNVKSFKELMEVILKPSHSNLRSLFVNEVSTQIEETDLKQLSLCQRLLKLYLWGEISNLPEPNLFPPNLTVLILQCSKLQQDPTPILERLPMLTFLSLTYNFYIGEEMVFSRNGFLRLKVLRLSSRFIKRLKVDIGAMPNLNELGFAHCKSLEMVPEGVRYITTLQNLLIGYMSKDFIRRLQVIDGKEGEDFYKVQHVPSIILIDGKSFISTFSFLFPLYVYKHIDDQTIDISMPFLIINYLTTIIFKFY